MANCLFVELLAFREVGETNRNMYSNKRSCE